MAFDADKLVDEEILGEEALDLKVENVDAFKLKQLELEHELKLKEMEMKERLEMEKKEKEDEFKLKELEMKEREKLKELEMRERLEMEKLKIEMVKEESNTKVHSKSDYFDAAKNIRLFEKIANNLKWPMPYWTTMLQSVFEGKAAEIYSALPSEKSSDYDTGETGNFESYELVPEAYRQKFRSYKKFDSQTYVEFAREKEDLFDKWLTFKENK
ncbi:Hypothetical predicted protein [Mytilus galloprovincialis]|uniref:Uncharacterized protein n=1 Tax=Mytilus galloprovincialis TaxID=29158 RepID=A0A8B6CJ43_MYTGA|nr:Hypothetical predicted protein [Mytilus galloprovincialis]